MQIPVIAETDVLVVGGGPGGLGAAVMAARNGAKTLLVERYGSADLIADDRFSLFFQIFYKIQYFNCKGN